MQPTDFDQLNPIHIAGTKGKGSTSSFISSILSQYLPTQRSIHAERLPSDVGLYTSPHLRFVRERIQVNNAFMSEDDFAACFYDIWHRLEAAAQQEGHPNPEHVGTKPVYFRYLTLMALHHFHRKEVGSAVIECGIGGEYDSTNILVKPSVAAITSLGIDHTAILGDNLESIAWHKAGILKPNVPAFTTPQPPAAMAVLYKRAEERQTELKVAPSFKALQQVQLGLFGEFQKLNAALAVSVSSTHLQRLGYSNLPDPLDANATLPAEFIRGLEDTRLGGRCEKRVDVHNDQLTWYIDGGHTLESIKLAGDWFASQTFTTRSSASLRILIFNQQTRDASALARGLYDTLAAALESGRPFQHVIFCTNTTYREAGYKADLVSINQDQGDVDSLKVQKELAKTWDSIDRNATVHIFSTIEEAVQQAQYLAQGRSANVLATGSLHLVGGALEVLETGMEK